MLCAVKHEDLSGDGLGGDEVGFLGHVPRPVDFAGMIDPLCDLDDLHTGLRRDGVATEFAPFVVIVRAVESVG